MHTTGCMWQAHGKFHDVSPDGHSALWLEEGAVVHTRLHCRPRGRGAHPEVPAGVCFQCKCEGGRQGLGLTGLAGWVLRLVGRGAGLFAGLALWEITDETVLAFVTDFYTRLLKGETVGEALCPAKKRCMQGG